MKKQINTFGISAAVLGGILTSVMVACTATGVGPANFPTGDAATTPASTAPESPAATPESPAATAPAAPAAVAGTRIDRVGLPAINTVLVGFNAFTSQLGVTQETGDAGQDGYNNADPKDDVASYKAAFSGALQKLFGHDAATGDTLADVVTPDLLPIDSTKATSFPNGRNLTDDVVDIELQLLSGVKEAGDKVGSNDKPFSKTFPYLADKH